LHRVAETPVLNLNRNAVAKLMTVAAGMLEVQRCHLHYRSQSEHDKHRVIGMVAAYVKGQDIPTVSPAPEDPLPHKLGVSAADIMHALLPQAE
jgi:hypothetical protein